jgi:hypothetical protein
MTQLALYGKIDALFKKPLGEIGEEQARSLINKNYAAREYFFSKAPIQWVTWLNANSFFEILKENRDESYYTMPELVYLGRVINEEGDQKEIVKIIKGVNHTRAFNPKMAQWTLLASPSLDIEEIKEIIPKIEQENWFFQLRAFPQSSYNYEPLIKKLSESESHTSLLLLARAMLQVNPDRANGNYPDQYFYLRDIHKIGLFKALYKLEGHYAEKAIEIFANIFSQFIQTDKVEDSAFPYSDSYYLSGIDFFDLNFKGEIPRGFREEIKLPLKVFVSLLQKTLGQKCDANERKIYDTYIKNLPNSQTLWRLKLFSMSQCPELFKEDLKKELYKIFSTPRYSQLFFGTEYLNALKRVFSLWEEPVQRDYIKQILDKFKGLIEGSPKEHWHLTQGWEILSIIASSLDKNEIAAAFKILEGRTLDKEFTPKIITPEVRGGMVKSRSPVNFSEKYADIAHLIQSLKTDLQVGAIEKKYKDDDFLNPRNAEGVGEELKKDMKNRMSEYLAHAVDFLSDGIHLHYTYSFLRGVEEYLRDKKTLTKTNWDNLFTLFDKIKESPTRDTEQAEENRLSGWLGIEKVMAELLKFFLRADYKKLFQGKRSDSLDLITYLLESSDPIPEHETNEYGGLYHIVINSTRGIAFEGLVNFIYSDGEKLNEDVLDLYKKTIKEATSSIQFVIGRYLASFYFRDEKEVSQLFENIFPRDPQKVKQFSFAWEGYLTNMLYKGLFDVLPEYYEYALSLEPSDVSKKKNTHDIDEGIGTHLALAFSRFGGIKYENEEKDPLLDLLWKSNDVKKQKAFISFLGRGIISHSNAGVAWFEEEKIDLGKLKALWELLLEMRLDADTYTSFGFWINYKKDIFDYDWLARMIQKTLNKTGGVIEWDHGIENKLLELAKANPEATLKIIERLFMGKLGAQSMNWFRLDDKKISVFKVLYEKEPAKTKSLINQLLEKGGRPFWPLRDIL